MSMYESGQSVGATWRNGRGLTIKKIIGNGKVQRLTVSLCRDCWISYDIISRSKTPWLVFKNLLRKSYERFHGYFS